MSPDRHTKIAASVATSAVAGLVGAFLVWNFIYAIGTSVVSDDTYARLESPVAWSSCAIGLIVGVLTFAVRRHHFSLRTLVVAHAVAVAAGFIGGSFRWDIGLYAYFGALIAFQLLMFWRAMFDYERRVAAKRAVLFRARDAAA